MCASVAVAQLSSDTEGEANITEEDEVLELVREMRESSAREPVVDRTISVYSSHYVIGARRFDSLEYFYDIGIGAPNECP